MMSESCLWETKSPILLIGDSLTWGLGEFHSEFCAQNRLVVRGICGQTSGEIKKWFENVVAETNPSCVHVWCGLNDIYGGHGFISLDVIEENITDMLVVAGLLGKARLLGAVTPTMARFAPSDPAPAPRIIALNRRLRRRAKMEGAQFIDYHTPLRTLRGGIQQKFTYDSIHLNDEGVSIIKKQLMSTVRPERQQLNMRSLKIGCRLHDALTVPLF